MPLKLIPPKQGKTPYWYVRGTHHGIYVERSTKATDRVTASRILKAIKQDIESGIIAHRGEPTFLDAAVLYMAHTGTEEGLQKIVERLGHLPLNAIKQSDIDRLAIELHPTGTPATRNRWVYTPVSAVLKHAGIETRFRRPKGWRGKTSVDWLRPEQAEQYMQTAMDIDPNFHDLAFLCLGTGCRRGEAQGLRCRDVWLSEAYILLPDTKTGEPRAVHLPPAVVAMLANRDLSNPDALVFGMSMMTVKRRVKEMKRRIPGLPNNPLHLMRHSFGAWMRRYSGLDDEGMLRLGVWKDRQSVSRYAHADVSIEARKADLLPLPIRAESGKTEKAVKIGKAKQ